MQARSVVRFSTAAIAIFALAVVGCQSTPEDGSDGSGGTGSEFGEENLGGTRGGVSSVDLSSLETVYFDYDAYTLRTDAKASLRNNANAINSNDAWGTITIEGHCDERGSEEYNLALGERRANGVKRYLVDLGVPASRLTTVSFGEAKPSAMGHDESAWRYNRRSEFTAAR